MLRPSSSSKETDLSELFENKIEISRPNSQSRQRITNSSDCNNNFANIEARDLLYSLKSNTTDPVTKIMKQVEQNDHDALLLAAEKGIIKDVVHLLDRGVDPSDCFGLGLFTPLHHACNRGHLLIAKLLVDSGSGVNVCNKSLETPLHLAAYNGHLSIVEFLLDKGASIDCKTDCEDTPLFYSSRRGHTTVIRQLLQRGADSTLRNRFDDLPISEARTDRVRNAFTVEVVGTALSERVLVQDILHRLLQFCNSQELSRAACVLFFHNICGRWQRAAEDRTLWDALGVKRWELSIQYQVSGFKPAAMASYRPGIKSRTPPRSCRKPNIRNLLGTTFGIKTIDSKLKRNKIEIETKVEVQPQQHSGTKRPSSGSSSPSRREKFATDLRHSCTFYMNFEFIFFFIRNF
eukprot:GSMAST32.ASY1.ANO1.92.1 assembled CDS